MDLTDRWGIPVAAALGSANHHDLTLLKLTLRAAGWRGLLNGIETLHLDRSYDSTAARRTGPTVQRLTGRRSKAGLTGLPAHEPP